MCVVSPPLQYFEHVEEAEWAVQVLKASGKPVAACMCIGPDGDMHGVSTGECAVRLVKAGEYILSCLVLCSLVVFIFIKVVTDTVGGWRETLGVH